MKTVIYTLLIVFLSLFYSNNECFAAEDDDDTFYDAENCKTFLSFWVKDGESLTIFDTSGKPHFGNFQRYDSKTDNLYIIEKEFENNIKTNTINYSNISKIVFEKKKWNMRQIRQATIIGSILGLVGAVIINKSQSDVYNRDNLKYNNIFLGLGIGAGAGIITGLIGNDRVKTQKVLDCK